MQIIINYYKPRSIYNPWHVSPSQIPRWHFSWSHTGWSLRGGTCISTTCNLWTLVGELVFNFKLEDPWRLASLWLVCTSGQRKSTGLMIPFGPDIGKGRQLDEYIYLCCCCWKSQMKESNLALGSLATRHVGLSGLRAMGLLLHLDRGLSAYLVPQAQRHETVWTKTTNTSTNIKRKHASTNTNTNTK